jgi:hypothetical protein
MFSVRRNSNRASPRQDGAPQAPGQDHPDPKFMGKPLVLLQAGLSFKDEIRIPASLLMKLFDPRVYQQ